MVGVWKVPLRRSTGSRRKPVHSAQSARSVSFLRSPNRGQRVSGGIHSSNIPHRNSNHHLTHKSTLFVDTPLTHNNTLKNTPTCGRGWKGLSSSFVPAMQKRMNFSWENQSIPNRHTYQHQHMPTPQRTVPLTSPHNPKLMAIRKAMESGTMVRLQVDPKEDPQDLLVCEGIHLFEEAMKSNGKAHVVGILVNKEKQESLEHIIHRFAGSQHHYHIENQFILDPAAFSTISSTVSSQGLITLVKPLLWTTYPDVIKAKRPYVILDSIRDPGNLGTIIRCAEAFDSSVVLLPGCVSPFNQKAIRASAGSLFRTPFVSVLSEDAISTPVYVMSEKSRKLFTPGKIELKEAIGLVFGGEAGFSSATKNLRKRAVEKLRIATSLELNSLPLPSSVAISLQNIYQEINSLVPENRYVPPST